MSQEMNILKVGNNEYEIVDAVARTAIGAPAVAVFAADMIDTSKIYVYTGSETGYTFGNWYYYDGTAWASGGVYQANGIGVGSVDGLRISNDIKAALLACLEKVAWVDDQGQTYYDALYNALYPPANLTSISCVYTQSGTVYDTDSLDSLKSDLVVTAHYSDQSTETVTTYTLSGTLTEGTSTITVTYMGKTTSFNVTVSSLLPQGYTQCTYIQSDGNSYIDTGITHTINTKVVLDYMSLKQSGASFQCPIGSSGTDSSASVNPYYFYIGSTNKVDGSMGGPSGGGNMNGKLFSATDSSIQNVIINYEDRKVYTMDSKNAVFSIDNTQYNVTNGLESNWGNTTLALFARKHPTQINAYAVGRIYSVKVYENDVLIADYVPVLNNNTNKYGLYDLVAEEFKDNSGSGIITGA